CGGAIGLNVALRSGASEKHPVGATVASSVPPMAARRREVAAWVDRGLLQLAGSELMDSSSGAELLAPQVEPGVGGAGSAGKPTVTSPSNDNAEHEPETLSEQRDEFYRLLAYGGGHGAFQIEQIRAIVEASPYFGQGNPLVTRHPMTREECRRRREKMPVVGDDARICGSPNMVALYDPDREEPAHAKLCIDQFEFPNLACEYPVVWVRASEASRICHILDKRLCDAHEWEGACAGKLRSPAKEYESWVNRLNAEYFHNQSRVILWATRQKPDARTCGTGALKSPGCVDASWEHCGTNSYPAGAFPRCVSAFGVYDLHGNVAEHMNLPLNETQLGSLGGSGETEMKGSWFAFDEYHPHPDDCRWRAPAWHATPIESESSHFNYHLGFRCCRDLD
ncbi:MAG TPA: SUMF1/EgtB/PvdO family nonheme iron enzyme, partial [Polyangiaceae bacterium]